MSNEEMAEIVRSLLFHLPDAYHGEDTDWTWCWEELNSDSQEAVKLARADGTRLLEHLWVSDEGPEPGEIENDE